MAAQPSSDSEQEVLLINPAQPAPGPSRAEGGSRAIGRVAPLAAAAFSLLAVVAVLSLQGPATPAEEAPPRQALEAGPAQANLSEASGLWGGQNGLLGVQSCAQCQQYGGSCCVDRPVVCCGRTQYCNQGRCVPNPRFTGGYVGHSAAPSYGYGGRPVYGGYGSSPLQRFGTWLSSLNPFARQQPGYGYGNGAYSGNSYGGGYGGGYSGGYGGGYSGNPLQRFGTWLNSLNPFARRQPRYGYGNAGFGSGESSRSSFGGFHGGHGGHGGHRR